LPRFISEDPIGLAGGVNTFLFVNANPLMYVDPLGLDTYAFNRDLGAFGSSARPMNDVLTHTATVTTNPDGSIAHTYSWGNEANPRGWNLDQSLDIKTAREALDKGYAQKISPAFMDAYYRKAFNQLNKPQFEHSNGVITNNCKTETGNLNERAWSLWATGQ